MAFVLFILAITVFGCTVPDRPGNLLDTFDVSGSQAKDTCAKFANTPFVQLSAEIRIETTGRAYWYTLEGPAIAGLKVDDEYRFIQLQEQPQLPPEPSVRYPGCTLVRRNTIEVTFPDTLDGGVSDAGSDPGHYTIDFAPTTTSDCTPILQGNGGTYAKLPCSVSYDITATSR